MSILVQYLVIFFVSSNGVISDEIFQIKFKSKVDVNFVDFDTRVIVAIEISNIYTTKFCYCLETNFEIVFHCVFVKVLPTWRLFQIDKQYRVFHTFYLNLNSTPIFLICRNFLRQLIFVKISALFFELYILKMFIQNI